ncbi:MAG: manganese efflux pump MntP family protein [Lachnospiraceae bacterium]|nr:manganese efflux pump MntP family protein [Lachnospiraceae bacterium]
MHYDILFFVNSILLGVGLAMDAFSVSVTNGIVEPDMKNSRRNLIAGTYAFFQFIMPVIGWIAVHTIIGYFNALEKFTPVIALILLLFIGIKMIVEAVQDRKAETVPDTGKGVAGVEAGVGDRAGAGVEVVGGAGVGDRAEAGGGAGDSRGAVLTTRILIIQGIATSIDALSVGVTFAEYDLVMALVASIIIAVVTFGICIVGLHIGHKVGERFSDKASIIGGCILIFIGLEIFFRGVIF